MFTDVPSKPKGWVHIEKYQECADKPYCPWKLGRLFSVFLQWMIMTSGGNILVSASSTSNFGQSSNHNYHIYNYDQTRQQFTPDGRLLQVEYASQAAEWSTPLLVVDCVQSSSHNTAAAAPLSQPSTSVYPCLIFVTIPQQANAPQQRIVILNQNNERNDSKDNRHDNTVVVALSGMLPDSLALLQAALQQQSQHQQFYHTPFSTGQLVQSLADHCQDRAMGGGIRPYGSTMLVCGFQRSETTLTSSMEDLVSSYRSVIYQTDPSGGILSHETNPRGNDNGRTGIVTSQVRCIVGGSPPLQRRIKQSLESAFNKLEQQQQASESSSSSLKQQHEQQRQTVTLAQRIAVIAKLLYKEMNTEKDTEQKSDIHSSSQPPLEVVLLSPNMNGGGCYRLDVQQLHAIRQLMHVTEDETNEQVEKV